MQPILSHLVSYEISTFLIPFAAPLQEFYQPRRIFMLLYANKYDMSLYRSLSSQAIALNEVHSNCELTKTTE